MLLNSLPCTGQPPQQRSKDLIVLMSRGQSQPAPNASPECERPWMQSNWTPSVGSRLLGSSGQSWVTYTSDSEIEEAWLPSTWRLAEVRTDPEWAIILGKLTSAQESVINMRTTHDGICYRGYDLSYYTLFISWGKWLSVTFSLQLLIFSLGL